MGLSLSDLQVGMLKNNCCFDKFGACKFFFLKKIIKESKKRKDKKVRQENTL